MNKTILSARLRIILLFTMVTLFFGCNKIEWGDLFDHPKETGSEAMKEKADIAMDWYKMQLSIILNNPSATPNPNRSFGFTGISLYESVRMGIPNSVSLSKRLNQMPDMPSPEKNKDYSVLAAANASLASITRSLFSGLNAANHISIDSLETAYNNRLKSTLPSSVFERSQIFGRSIASAVFEWSKSDKFDLANAPYTPPIFPGAWQATPPAFANAVLPYASNCRPFLESHASGFGAAFPFEYSEATTSAFYKIVREVYDVSKSLTTDQRNIALFWNDVGLGRGYSPPGHEISVINQIIALEKINLGLAAQAYAKAGMAQWDGQIMCWRAKYKYNLVRPVTYIQKVIEPGWLPLIPTPPHPEYPAAHAYITAATMAAVGLVIGDSHTFTDHTYDFLGYPSRSFTSIADVGKEAGISRLYGGIHYRISINTGLEAGKAVGTAIGKISLNK